MGGMGPAAANAFGQKVISQTPANKDQEHARVLIDQATDIPDRTAAILRNGRSPVEAMTASLKRLDRGEADVVAITCNTAHHFFGDMQAAVKRFGLNVELLHIVDASLAQLPPGAKTVGLLATSGTLEAKIYEKRAAELDLDLTFKTPSSKTQAAHVMPGIYADGVKAGNMARGREHLLTAAKELQQQGVDAILLACTEIPLVLTSGDLRKGDGTALPMIDTLGALASAALTKSREMQASSRVDTPHGCLEVAAEGLTHFVQSASDFIHGTPERPRRLGVMGGMGPAAAIQFSQYMVDFNTAATSDQQHVPLLLDQATDIPDRTAAIQGTGKDPLPAMLASLHRLAAAGADDLVITCNTAHHFYDAVVDEIQKSDLAINPIHIVDATMSLLDSRVENARKIGLLATTGTVSSGIYQNRAEDRTWVTPDDTLQKRVMSGIYDGVKAGDAKRGHADLLAAARHLADQGVDAILLACTEIPLVLKQGDVKDSNGQVVPLIDTLEAQARAAIRRSGEGIPATPGLVQQVARLLGQGPAPAAQPDADPHALAGST
jgi:aspartate racemase